MTELTAPNQSVDEVALGGGAVTRENTQAVFGQVMGLVALTVGCAALGAYVGRGAGGPPTANAVKNTIGVYRTPLIEVSTKIVVMSPRPGRIIDIIDCNFPRDRSLEIRETPEFLKIAYNGPRALEELASFDPGVVVGVLGGGAGTARDCFELIRQAEKYGARVALFGRKINLAESPLDIVRLMRAVADGSLTPLEAVKDYHAALQKQGLKPIRALAVDTAITESVLLAA